MAKVPYEVIKENYLQRTTFIYNRLKSEGYFDLFNDIKKLASVEGSNLNWDNHEDWEITSEAWEAVQDCNINPMIVFVHPVILQQYPIHLKYYRSISTVSQKTLIALSKVSSVKNIEQGKVKSGTLSDDTAINLASVLNESLSRLVSLVPDLDEDKLQGMMYATAGTNIDGSWRNSIGAKGERVIRSIILKELLAHDEVLSIIDKQNRTIEVKELKATEVLDAIESIKSVNLINGYYMVFSSEPDISIYNDSDEIVCAIEIKAGTDPAGALERLGAMLKSFDNTLQEFPNATTILVASCTTDEVESRLGASTSVGLKYITSEITSSEKNKRKFANRIRKFMKLI